MSKVTLRFACIAFMSAAAAQAQQPSWTPPSPAERCPSKWGANDERGSMNHQKPAAVLAATKLIRTGEVIELGHVLNGRMPFSGTRRFDVHTKRTFMNPQSNRRGSNEETVLSEIGQVGTQFDGFAHQTHGELFYNCIKVDEVATRSGFTKLGIHNVGTIMTRGVMIDVAGLKGVEMLPTGYEITIEDLQNALKRQGTALRPGDAILIHGGWGRLWGKDNVRYQTGGHAGIGVSAAEWLIRQDPILLGADNGTVEISPTPDKLISLPVHQLALVVHGVHLLENLKLDELAVKKVYEFAFIMQPLKIEGGTGSTVAPVAVR
ncbi:MAG TPA: cyclase family protein [Burkholderiales bacterium]|nr:cyclase family protein [Burkholderiales bacterium]